MLVTNPVAQGIVDGRITRVYRRWDAPRARAGGRQTTRFGVVAIDSVEEIARIDDLSDADAQAAGEIDRAALVRLLTKRDSGRIFQIRVHYAGPDPRLTLRAELPDAEESLAIDRALQRLDAAKSATSPGPWTHFILEWIRDNPAVVSKELAAVLGRELQPMKVDIRKLKALGLTISLDVGYQLSPRGVAYLGWRASR